MVVTSLYSMPLCTNLEEERERLGIKNAWKNKDTVAGNNKTRSQPIFFCPLYYISESTDSNLLCLSRVCGFFFRFGVRRNKCLR